ncbi:hypothetical protein M405DRAFT_343696 [Rhizopogon salebrosus TDB-379]|nr:hypothetical protein M405DRAFT_343696 [Rhizopogon salebrosus TDB-379]
MDSQPPPPLVPISDIITTAWPRRAVKACASCRRDKIRCDGNKPCGGCIKKGYSIEQCVAGCENCRKARARCEDGKPCLRCREEQVECTEAHIHTILRVDPPPVLVLRGAHRSKPDRAKLACQNCRRDNKKCDDQRPCPRCVARGEECVHLGKGPKLVKLRCEGCRQDNKKCEDARPCRQCVEHGRDCVSVQRKGRGHGTRVKAACVYCRRDKVRCGGARPCGHCVRKGYQCIDRICQTCTQQGIDGECPHREAQIGDLERPDDDVGSSSQHHLPTIGHVQQSSMMMAPPPFPSHVYGPTPYHVLATQSNHEMGPPLHPPALSAIGSYYPIIDPAINGPRPNISSERYDPSLLVERGTNDLLKSDG